MLDTADRLEILDLYARYGWHFDQGKAEEWAALFTPDGRFLRSNAPDIEGREGLADLCRQRQAKTPGLRHLTSNVTLEPANDGARGRAYVLVVRIGDDGSLRVFTLGDYDDELVKLPDGWRFQRRTFSHWLAPELVDSALLVTS